MGTKELYRTAKRLRRELEKHGFINRRFASGYIRVQRRWKDTLFVISIDVENETIKLSGYKLLPLGVITGCFDVAFSPDIPVNELAQQLTRGF